MAVLAIQGLLRDAASSLKPIAQRVDWPRGEDGTLYLTVSGPTGAPHDLTGCSIIFAVRDVGAQQTGSPPPAPLISRAATIVDALNGVATVGLVEGDTINLTELHLYRYDIELTAPSGARTQVVSQSDFLLLPIVSYPTDTVTVPPSATPLATGPSWLNLSLPEQIDTDGTTSEQWIKEVTIDFDNVTSALPNMFAEIAGLASVSGGTGTVRARYGGASRGVDGTLIFASSAITGTTPAVMKASATVAKPTGLTLVKLTLQNSTNGQTTSLRGAGLSVRGAA